MRTLHTFANLLVVLLLISSTPLSAQEDTTAARPGIQPHVIPLDTPVITIDGLCDSNPAEGNSNPQKSTHGPGPSGLDNPACKTVITRAQFELLTDALNPQMPVATKRALAQAYPRLLSFGQKARELGLDTDLHFRTMAEFTCLQLLSQTLTREMTSKGQRADIEKIAGTSKPQFNEAYFGTLARPESALKPDGVGKEEVNKGLGQQTSGTKPVDLSEGQTSEDVKKVLGEPIDSVKVGQILVYIYPTAKVFFTDNKLTDVQERNH
jgi:hypothetical protein